MRPRLHLDFLLYFLDASAAGRAGVGGRRGRAAEGAGTSQPERGRAPGRSVAASAGSRVLARAPPLGRRLPPAASLLPPASSLRPPSPSSYLPPLPPSASPPPPLLSLRLLSSLLPLGPPPPPPLLSPFPLLPLPCVRSPSFFPPLRHTLLFRWIPAASGTGPNGQPLHVPSGPVPVASDPPLAGLATSPG